MRLIGLDLGKKTMGIAITDSLKIVANGIDNFIYKNEDLNECIIKLDQVFNKYNDVETIVLGYPTRLNGNKCENTLLVEKFERMLVAHYGNKYKIVLQNEQFTTVRSTEILKYEFGLKSSKIKKIKDKMSAVIILEEYMQSI
jgi:putative Holliday junction resolvase